jgi:hypothetical protein
VRLEMRSVAGLAVAVLSLLVSAACCCKRPFLIGDTISGGPDGSALVKVAITLGYEGGSTSCKVLALHPDKVYVVPGAAIRWKVKNACDPSSGSRLLKFLQPRPKASVGSSKPATVEASAPDRERTGAADNWSFANCTSELVLGPGTDPKNGLLCEVPEGVQPGLYKYGLTGDHIETFDPDIEVRRGPK